MTESAAALEARLRAGDTAAAGELFAACRDRLQGRLDASDVLQEAFLDVQKKAAEFAAKVRFF